jgi:hypothetical protein
MQSRCGRAGEALAVTSLLQTLAVSTPSGALGRPQED